MIITRHEQLREASYALKTAISVTYKAAVKNGTTTGGTFWMFEVNTISMI